MSKPLSQSQRQRWQFIESCLLWEGALQRKDICEAFGLTLNHVTREITAYRKEHKDNLVYDPESRVWRIGPRFEPAYATGDAGEYLAMLHAYALSREASVMITAGPVVAAEALPPVTSKIERPVLSEVIGALRRSGGVTVKYQSFSDPEPSERTLWPHALVFANERWHVRAYDSRKQRFSDFVLARILNARPESEVMAAAASEHDADWQSEVVIDVVPAIGLSPTQEAVVAREFGMRRQANAWLWKVSLRACLAKYFLRAHRLDLPVSAAPHRRIALRDASLAKRYAFTDD
jgi:hypothetical protein